MFDFFFFFNDTATTEIYTLSLHDALPISAFADDGCRLAGDRRFVDRGDAFDDLQIARDQVRSEEHTSELQSQFHLVCRLLLEKKKKKKKRTLVIKKKKKSMKKKQKNKNT